MNKRTRKPFIGVPDGFLPAFKEVLTDSKGDAVYEGSVPIYKTVIGVSIFKTAEVTHFVTMNNANSAEDAMYTGAGVSYEVPVIKAVAYILYKNGAKYKLKEILLTDLFWVKDSEQ